MYGVCKTPVAFASHPRGSVGLARCSLNGMRVIQSWFDNKDQLAATATSMAKYLQQSEKAAILPEGVSPEYIKLLLWAMEQTDSLNPIVRERW